MGLIKAAKDSISTLLADQWREYFYCDSLSDDILMMKGSKRVTEGRNSNTKGVDNIISNGSIIVVNEGQCMMIVDQGGIVDFCAEAGEFIYDTSSEPSLFYGNFGDNIKKSLSTVFNRFTFGGNTAKDQRVYYFNTKEITKNFYGTPNPVPFRVVDANIGLDIDISLKCSGEYSFKIADPLVFYKNIAGNVKDEYNKKDIVGQLKGELITSLQPALAKISAMGVRYSALPAYTKELTEALNAELSEDWLGRRGIQMVSMTIKPVADEEDEKMISDLQRTAVFRNADMRMANLSTAQADAMKMAASNESAGPTMAFAAMNMSNMMGMNATAMYGGGMQQGMGMQQQQPQQNAASMGFGGGAFNTQPTQQQAPVLGWSCSCGKTDNRGKFCAECGSPKPAAAGWTCSCGHVNQGKFCAECGSKKPTGAPMYKCDKCGWEPEDPANPPKFCPECGDIFDQNDVK